MGEMQPGNGVTGVERSTFLVTALFTEQDDNVFDYFNKFRGALDKTTGADLFLGLPDAENGMVKDLEKLFGPEGAARYPGLKRADLPCLWIEDDEDHHVIVRLPDNRDKLTALLRGVTDAAAASVSFRDLEAAIAKLRDVQAPVGPDAQDTTGGNEPLDVPGGPVMEVRIFRILGQIAGLAGIVAGVFLFIFRDILKQKFLPQAGLTNVQAFHVIIALMIFTFGIAAIGMIAWIVGARQDDSRKPVPPGTLWVFVTLVCVVLLAVVVVLASPAGSSLSSNSVANSSPTSATPTTAPNTAPAKPMQKSLPVNKTGDHVVDGVEANLAALRTGPGDASEDQILTALTPLFNRAAFSCFSTEDLGYMLWAVSKTRLILTDHLAELKTRPDVRSRVGQTIQILLKMQNDIAKSYGGGFSSTDHIRRYIGNQGAFVKNLPPVLVAPDQNMQNERLVDVQHLRATLTPMMALQDDPGCVQKIP